MAKPIQDKNTLIFKDIGSLVRNIRLSKDIGQEKLAVLSDISSKTLSAFEKGRHNVSLGSFFQICEALDVEPEYVLGMRNSQAKINVCAMCDEIKTGIDKYEHENDRASKTSK